MRTRNRIRLLSIVAVAIGITLSGCQVLQTPAVSLSPVRREAVQFEEETSVRVDTYDIAAAESPMEICVRIVVVAGSLEWAFTNPEGKQARSKAAATEQGPHRATHCFEAAPGRWVFRAQMTGATGQYAVAWREVEPGTDTAGYLLDFDDGGDE